MRIGYVLPVSDRGMDGWMPRWTDILAQARAAEEVGFDSIWVPDHLILAEAHIAPDPRNVAAIEALGPVIETLRREDA